MRTLLPALVAFALAANAFAETATVESVSLYEPPRRSTLGTFGAGVSPNSWIPPACITCEEVAAIQAHLLRLGYRPGPLDGIIGPLTRAAIKSFQLDHGLPDDGRATESLLQRLASTL